MNPDGGGGGGLLVGRDDERDAPGPRGTWPAAAGDPGLEAEVVSVLAASAVLPADAGAELIPHLGRAAARLEAAGAHAEASEARAVRAHALLLLDARPAPAAEEARRVLAEPRASGAGRRRARLVLGAARSALGEEGEAREVLLAALGAPGAGDGRPAALLALAEHEWLASRAAQAASLARGVGAAPSGAVLAAMSAPLLRWGALESGSGEQPALSPSPPAALVAYVLESRALDALLAGDHEAAESGLLAVASGQRHPLAALRARLGAAEAARRAGAGQRARAHLLAAREDAVARAARGYLPRIEAALQRTTPAAASTRRRARGELSTREEQVLMLVGDGHASASIAALLGIDRTTVDSHVLSARRKLGARSRREAALRVAAADPAPARAGAPPRPGQGESPRDKAEAAGREALVAALAPELRELLDVLLEGASLAEAAGRLHYSRRTINRRLADLRAALGVRSTAQALVLARNAACATRS